MAEFVTVAHAGEIAPFHAKQVEVHGKLISVWFVDGAYYAISDICSHEEAYLSEGDIFTPYCVSCPLHGAEFDIRDGAAKCLPATEPVPTYPTRVMEDEIQVAI